jgi:hypothetical protein
MTTPTAERRRQRSNEHSTALRYQLESTRKRGRMTALALTDSHGLLVAYSGDSGLCAELGAVAPLLARGAPHQISNDASHLHDVAVRAIECFGEPLFLASVGGGVAREALLSHSARGIQRILTSN